MIKPCLYCGNEFKSEPAKKRKFCSNSCSQKWQAPYRTIPLKEKIWRRAIKRKNGCIEWIGPRSKAKNHHIQIVDKGKVVGVHLAVYELEKDKIPDGMFVCHHCDNPICINPEHLFLGTTQQNTTDKVLKGRHPTGHKNWQAKLTKREVIQIRKRYKPKINGIKLANEFKTSLQTIYNCVTRRTYKNIP